MSVDVKYRTKATATGGRDGHSATQDGAVDVKLVTPKELGELGQLARARPVVEADDFPEIGDDAMLEPGMRKSVNHLRSFQITAADAQHKPIEIAFDFFAMPVEIQGDGKVEKLVVEKTSLGKDLGSVGTGERYELDCQMVISCIGCRTPPIEGVPYEHGRGRFANTDGRILPGLYCVGWAKRGPSGTIGTNKPDGFAVVEMIDEDVGGNSRKAGRPGLDALLAERGVEAISFRDWKKIEQAEIARAREGSPREKFTDIAEMIAARKA